MTSSRDKEAEHVFKAGLFPSTGDQLLQRQTSTIETELDDYYIVKYNQGTRTMTNMCTDGDFGGLFGFENFDVEDVWSNTPFVISQLFVSLLTLFSHFRRVRVRIRSSLGLKISAPTLTGMKFSLVHYQQPQTHQTNSFLPCRRPLQQTRVPLPRRKSIPSATF